MGFWMSKWGWFLIIPCLFCWVMSIFRWEWLVVAPILLFIVYPAILTFIYLAYGMTEDGIRQLQLHQLKISNGKIYLIYLKREGEDDSLVTDYVRTIPVESIKYVSESRTGVTLRLRNRNYGHLYIPAEAIEEIRPDLLSQLKESGTLFV